MIPVVLFACASAEPDTGMPCTDEEAMVDWETWGAGFFDSYCGTCHSAGAANRYGAPNGLDFDTLADVRAQAAAIERVVNDEGTMPVGGGVIDADRETLTLFLRCGL